LLAYSVPPSVFTLPSSFLILPPFLCPGDFALREKG
jgi:hypothetical protein